MTTATPAAAQFPAPAGAVRVEEWAIGASGPRDVLPVLYRDFTGTTWVIERDNHDRDVIVTIEGTQFSDRPPDRTVSVERLAGYEDRLTPAQARQLARHLIAAANEIEQASQYDEIAVAR